MKIIELDETESTNEYCKKNYSGNSFAVTALKQKSEYGGLYLSVIRKLYNFESTHAFQIEINAYTAVCRTLECYGVKPVICWADGVQVNGKKICSTKIENFYSGSFISRSVTGINLSVNNSVAETSHLTTLKEEAGRKISITEVRDNLLSNLNKKFTLSDYKSYIDWLGKQITITKADKEFSAIAVDVDFDGKLICIIGGSLKKISSAEVSIKL